MNLFETLNIIKGLDEGTAQLVTLALIVFIIYKLSIFMYQKLNGGTQSEKMAELKNEIKKIKSNHFHDLQENQDTMIELMRKNQYILEDIKERLQ